MVIKTNNKKYKVIIDDEDFDKVKNFTWYYDKGYIVALVKGQRVLIHRLILSAKEDVVVDHKNGNTLDNRKCNIRVCTHAQNVANAKKRGGCKSKFKGVFPNKNKTRWLVYCGPNTQNRYIGSYGTEIEAAKAYDRVALALYGEFAKLNFPSGDDR